MRSNTLAGVAGSGTAMAIHLAAVGYEGFSAGKVQHLGRGVHKQEMQSVGRSRDACWHHLIGCRVQVVKGLTRKYQWEHILSDGH